MITARTMTRGLLGVMFSVGATLAVASPASAHPEIINLNCESAWGQVDCVVTHIGTASPYTVRWQLNGKPVPAADDRDDLQYPCTIGNVVGVKVTVTDAHGDDSASTSVRCRRTPL